MSLANRNDEILVSEQEVFDVLKFATTMYGTNLFGNALSPILLNERMKQINLNGAQATEANLTKALNSPKDSESELLAYSQDFEIQSQIYKSLIGYLSNLLAFDLNSCCVLSMNTCSDFLPATIASLSMSTLAYSFLALATISP